MVLCVVKTVGSPCGPYIGLGFSDSQLRSIMKKYHSGFDSIQENKLQTIPNK